MRSTIVTLASMATSVAASLGSGIIINSCDYEVDLNNVPSADGVHSAYATTLAANGGSYSQVWTALENSDGWSMKLNPGDDTSSIMQFEYTYATDEPDDLWFDLSYVNGAPFESDWVISSNSDSCVVKQTAYNNPTDDANGMQPLCSPEVSITVTLCSGSNSTTTSSSSSSSSSVAATGYKTSSSSTSVAKPTSSSVSSTASTATSTTADPSPTTLATVTTSAATIDQSGAVVTTYDTAVVTDVVTVYSGNHHWQRHQHGHHRHARV